MTVGAIPRPVFYKVIFVDNFARETEADRHCVGWLTKEAADAICDLINTDHQKTLGSDRVHYARVVPNDYRLSRGMEDLI